MKRDIYPVTIVADRYNGTYSGGIFTAWNCYPKDVPEDIEYDDCSCSEFFRSYDKPYGVGDTPTKAYKDLRRKLENECLMNNPGGYDCF